jgi:exodeoxyribonuclease VII small subunit
MKKEPTYEAAYNELKDIVSDIEQENISVDTITQKIKRAMELISFCREKLLKAGKEMNEALKENDN